MRTAGCRLDSRCARQTHAPAPRNVPRQGSLAFAQRAAAAFWAISLRRLLLSFSARARPPTLPAVLPMRLCSVALSFRARCAPPILPASLAIAFLFSGASF